VGGRARYRFRRATATGTVGAVKLEGDEAGIAVLKAMHDKDKDYLKFLVGEARTNTDLKAPFKSEDGTAYVLRVDPKSGNLIVERA
jgi:hypothetical protein